MSPPNYHKGPLHDVIDAGFSWRPMGLPCAVLQRLVLFNEADRVHKERGLLLSHAFPRPTKGKQCSADLETWRQSLRLSALTACRHRAGECTIPSSRTMHKRQSVLYLYSRVVVDGAVVEYVVHYAPGSRHGKESSPLDCRPARKNKRTWLIACQNAGARYVCGKQFQRKAVLHMHLQLAFFLRRLYGVDRQQVIALICCTSIYHNKASCAMSADYSTKKCS